MSLLNKFNNICRIYPNYLQPIAPISVINTFLALLTFIFDPAPASSKAESLKQFLFSLHLTISFIKIGSNNYIFMRKLTQLLKRDKSPLK